MNNCSLVYNGVSQETKWCRRERVLLSSILHTKGAFCPTVEVFYFYRNLRQGPNLFYRCEYQNICGYLKFPRAKARISQLAIMTALCFALSAEYGSEFSCAAYGLWTWFPSTSLFMRPLVAFFVAFTCSGSGPTQEDSPIKYKVLVHTRATRRWSVKHVHGACCQCLNTSLLDFATND